MTADPASKRITSIDVLRGLVMVIMALDHTRDFFHRESFTADPLDLHTTTPILFFTRWITHYCAPVFVFLAGTSAWFVGQRKTKAALTRFLLTRGVWLIFAEVAIVNLGWSFDLTYHTTFLQVIWAIGISMVLLAILVRLPWPVLLALGLAIVCGHNLVDNIGRDANGNASFWWNLMHHAQFVFYSNYISGHNLVIAYAFLPWTGLMICGYCFGKCFTHLPQDNQTVIIRRLGWVLLILFVLLRGSNLYGDPQVWTEQKNGLYTFLSFINVNKYPPSLLYAFLMLGPALLLLAALRNRSNRLTEILAVFGRVPFFYYLAHIVLIHTLTIPAFFMQGFGADQIAADGAMFLFVPPGFGYGLGAVYAVWIVVVVLLYPLCRWFDRYKQTHRQWWLSYV